MPYCSKCGTLVDEDATFCNKCGATIKEQADTAVIASPMIPINTQTSVLSQQENSRKEALTELDQMIKYFSKKQHLYDEYDHCIERIAYYSDPKTRVPIVGSTGKGRIIAGSIIMGIFAFFTLIALLFVDRDGNGLDWVLLWGAIMGVGIFLLASGVKIKNENSWYSVNEKETRLANNKKKFEEVANELAVYYQKYGYCPTGPSYTNPKILKQLRELIYTGRADSIKEAINLMHQDAHNSAMELQATLAAQSAASAARGANAAAFFTAANFFLK